MGLRYRLKFERKRQGWSQRYLAELTGIPSSNISRYENGERKPDIDTLIRLADFLNCSVDYLVGRTDTPVCYDRVEQEDLEDLLWRKLNHLTFRGQVMAPQDIKNLVVILEIIAEKNNSHGSEGPHGCISRLDNANES